MNDHELMCALIKSVNTRFIYQGKLIIYRIIINYEENEEQFVKEFTDYPSYRLYHDNLVNIINSNIPVRNELKLSF